MLDFMLPDVIFAGVVFTLAYFDVIEIQLPKFLADLGDDYL